MAARRALASFPPSSGAIVMGTGIVSGALSLDGREFLSHVLLVIAGAVWAVLAVSLLGAAVWDREGALMDARSPAALTGVAATAVLGTRLALLGWAWAGGALLALAFALWMALIFPILRNWVTPTVGTSLMLTVGTESLAVLAAATADRQGISWLLYAALVPFLLGLCFYVFVISRFDLHQLVAGLGDHWITGGALAISALAAARITLAAQSIGALGGVTGALEACAIALWALTVAWLPVLVACEALRPRWAYDVRRWSTVFPIGMSAAASFVAGTAAGAPALVDFARVWVWVALAVWLVVFVALVRRGLSVTRPARHQGCL